jgi:hypothetical protein
VKIKVGEVEYTVQPLALELAPYEARLVELLQKTPQDFSEAEKVSVEIKQLREKILSETVTPAPKPEHSIRLYQAVMELTRQEMTAAGLFRSQKHGINEEDSSACSAAASPSQ